MPASKKMWKNIFYGKFSVKYLLFETFFCKIHSSQVTAKRGNFPPQWASSTHQGEETFQGNLRKCSQHVNEVLFLLELILLWIPMVNTTQLFWCLQSQQSSEYSSDDLHEQFHWFLSLFEELKQRQVGLDIGHLRCSVKNLFIPFKNTCTN